MNRLEKSKTRRWGYCLVCLGLIATLGCSSREERREKVQREMFQESVGRFCDAAEKLAMSFESDAKMAERNAQVRDMDGEWLRVSDAPKGYEDLKVKIDQARGTLNDENSAVSDNK